MNTRAIVPAVTLACLLAGCGGGEDEPSEVAAACVATFRFEGKVYTGFDYASKPSMSELGVADEATCDDNGPEVGVSFPENPRQVTVWAFEGVDPDIAIGMRDTTGDVMVLVAEDIPESKAQHITDRLE